MNNLTYQGHQNQSHHNDEIDLKDVLKTVYNYRYIIIAITIVFIIGSAVFAYLKPNIYSSNITIELSDDKKSKSQDMVLESLMGGSSVNIDNEIEVLKSRFIAKKVADKLNLNTRYFISKNFRTIELYKNAPFVVTAKIVDDEILNKKFSFEPIDDKTFRLVVEPIGTFSSKNLKSKIGLASLSTKDEFEYDQVHSYGETIVTPFSSFVINKISNMPKANYSFVFSSNETVYDMIRQNLSVSQVSRNATIVSVSYTDNSSLRAKDVLDVLYQVYYDQEVEQKNKVSKLTLDFIDEQLDSINTRLKKSEKNLETFKEENVVVDLAGKATLTSEQITKYESSLQELEIEENILTNLQQYIIQNRDLSGLTVGAVNFADTSLGKLVVKLQELSTQKATLLIDYTEMHPDVQKLELTIATLRRSIKDTLKSNLRQIRERKESIKKVIAKYTKSLENLPKQERELTRLARYFSVNEKIYSYLLEKRAETAISMSSTVSNSRVLDEAMVNPYPIKPKRAMIVAVGFILGLIVGLAYTFGREFFNNTIKNSEDVEKYSSIPIYGVVPENKSKKTNAVYMEAFRNIRTNLQFLPKNEKNNIIAITSSVSGEGKTTIASKLADVLGQAGKKVMVIDLDLRKANVHLEFNVPNKVGMSNYLIGQNSLEEVTQVTKVENVSVITTGPLPPNPSELLLGDNMKELIKLLEEKYDYVILDTPPVGLVTDAAILMNYADISFMVVRADYTRKEFVKNLDRMAKEYHNNHVGMILNGVEIGSKYGYGYGSSYGYGYGNEQYYKNR